jgi:alpha/beta superfamily hydrolase
VICHPAKKEKKKELNTNVEMVAAVLQKNMFLINLCNFIALP